MELTNITGPDAMPNGFSAVPPRQESAPEPERAPAHETRPQNEKGGEIDTYA
jgi:hypothetical protein